MSRIGNAPIEVPQQVQVTIAGQTVTVKGPKGELAKELPAGLTATLDGGVLSLGRANDERELRSKHGLFRALLQNMVTGVSEGHRKVLVIAGIGFRAEQIGRYVQVQAGFSHPVMIAPEDGVELAVEGTNRIVVSGADKELVGDMAARIRAVRKVRPYLFRGDFQGIRYEDERPRRKAGKQGA